MPLTDETPSESLLRDVEEARLRIDEALHVSATVLAATEAKLVALEAQGVADRAALAELLAEIAGLRQAMESRAAIEQAKGVIIGATGCDEDAAFRLLAKQSQHENRKLRDVAEELVRSKQLRLPLD